MSVDFDLSKLPLPDAITQVSYDDNLNSIIAKFQELEPDFTAYLESDPIAKIFEADAYVLTLKDQQRNEQVKSVLISHAKGNDLDNLAALFGVARESDESDDRYRTRILMSLYKVSSAGAKGYYEALAYDADSRVIDAYAYDIESDAAKAFVVIQSSEVETGEPTQELLDIVQEYLIDEDRKPLGVQVFVLGVQRLDYAIEANIVLEPNVDSELVLQTMHDNITKLVEARKKIASGIAISEIYAALNVEGLGIVQELVSPSSNIVSSATQLPYCTSILINEV